MSNLVIKADQLVKCITGILNDYDDDVIDALKKESRKAARSMVRKTKSRAYGYGWKKYPGSIAMKKLRENSRGITYVWYVKSPHYRLSHLLEKGHATVNGGRTRAFPFIAPSLDEVEQEYLKGVKSAIESIR